MVETMNDRDTLVRVLSTPGLLLDSKGRYLHWDDMRNHEPPNGLTRSQWWLGTSIARQAMSRALPVTSVSGVAAHFNNVDPIQEAVHRLYQQASGQIIADDAGLQSSDRYRISSLVEEAITSSQLEGASTTRKVAKEMIASGRKPRDPSEQMILNNYFGMQFAQGHANEELTVDTVLDLHHVLTEDTLKPDSFGRLQTEDETRIAVYWGDMLLHQPPPARELPARLEQMCAFANGETPEGFLHPIVRAIVLHFWLAYDHPFEDGNGRTARALFYWSLLHDDYWLAQYISISSILRKAPARYARSFLLTETDNFDLTYFVIYQLNIIERAVKSLHEYLGRKMAETREIERTLRGTSHLNQRQLSLLGSAMRDPSEAFTFVVHAQKNRITHQTARTDLLGLEALGLLVKTRVGKRYVFRVPSDLSDRLRELGAQDLRATAGPAVGGQ
jgi:Fic family protein